MTVPPLRKWRPRFGLYRSPGHGVQFFVHPHPYHNPIIVLSRYDGKWYIELGRLSWGTGRGFHIRPKFF